MNKPKQSTSTNNTPTTERCVGSIYTSVDELPKEFVNGIWKLEKELGMPIWLIIQNENSEYGFLESTVYNDFFVQRNNLPNGNPVALLVHSLGGDATATYRLAKLLVKRCGNFTALVPTYAKSAATLLVLGASRIVLGTYAELGPLDVQVEDANKRKYDSALNHIQTLERINAHAISTLSNTMFFLERRTKLSLESIIPFAVNFTGAVVSPLVQSIDVVKYTEMSRLLKIGEDYAINLLKSNYGIRNSEYIAHALVSNYPEHDFPIDQVEATSIGLEVEVPKDKIDEAFTEILPFMNELTVIGRLRDCDAR